MLLLLTLTALQIWALSCCRYNCIQRVWHVAHESLALCILLGACVPVLHLPPQLHHPWNLAVQELETPLQLAFLADSGDPLVTLRAAAIVVKEHWIYMFNLDESPATCDILSPFACYRFYARSKTAVILKQDDTYFSCTPQLSRSGPLASLLPAVQEQLGLSFVPTEFVPDERPSRAQQQQASKRKKGGKCKASGETTDLCMCACDLHLVLHTAPPCILFVFTANAVIAHSMTPIQD